MREDVDTSFIIVITDPGGGVVTAFPGRVVDFFIG